MNYNDFILKVKKTIEERVKDDRVQVELQSIVKPNDMKYEAIIISKDSKICAPAVYLEDFYDMFLNGAAVEEIADFILDFNEKCRSVPQMEYFDYYNWEDIKDTVTARVLNYAANEEYLKGAVYERYLDLAIVFYNTIINESRDVFSSKISVEQLENWGLSREYLQRTAMDNTKRLFGVYIQEVSEVFKDMLGREGQMNDPEIMNALDDSERAPMYVVSNTARCHGSVVMFMNDVLEGIADNLEDDLYIIPSSIHEVMAIPVHARLKKDDVDDMIRDINLNLLEPQDILANHVYIYSREMKKII